MPLTRFLIGMGLGTALGWISWLVVLFRIDPETSGIFGRIFFYASLLIAVTGTASLLGFGARVFFFKTTVMFSQLAISLRQGVWFGVIVITALALQAAELFGAWNIVILALLFGVVETLFLSKEKHLA
ncbi:MAG TPA: hypothetical protein VJC11_00580 [Patescibacteria group bacterium]|nr:hypothetical protein [Patescibacteria group bacterium]